MDVNLGYGIFRLLRARVDLGHGGKDGRIFFYMLYDRNAVRLFHSHYVDRLDPDFSKYNIKMNWNSFCSLVDGEHPERYLSEIQTMVSDLSEVFREIGVHDLNEDNMAKIRGLEKTFVQRTGQFYDGQVVSFIKVDSITVIEAENLLALFPEDVDLEDSEEKEEVSLGDVTEVEKKSPNAIVSCFTVMDPLRGVPVSSIVPGDIVTLVIPEDSFVYKSMKAQDGAGFTDRVERVVRSVKESDTDRVILEFDLFEGIGAISVAQKSLKIKASSGAEFCDERAPLHFTPVKILILAGFFFLALFVLIYRFLI